VRSACAMEPAGNSRGGEPAEEQSADYRCTGAELTKMLCRVPPPHSHIRGWSTKARYRLKNNVRIEGNLPQRVVAAKRPEFLGRREREQVTAAERLSGGWSRSPQVYPKTVVALPGGRDETRYLGRLVSQASAARHPKRGRRPAELPRLQSPSIAQHEAQTRQRIQ
jgi:hypothetical protein